MRSMRWGRILLAGFLAESLSVAFLVGLRYWQGGSVRSELSPLGNATFEVELFVVTALFGWWAARKATFWPLLHGALVAGALGGWIAGWQASARTRAPVA